MDVGHTYAGRDLSRVMIYAPPGLTPPNTIELLQRDGAPAEFVRLADGSLACESTVGYDLKSGKPKATGACKSIECHRAVIGECQCGRHQAPVRVARAQ